MGNMNQDNRRFMLRLPDDLAARLAAAATIERRSYANIIRYAIALYLDDKYPEPAQPAEQPKQRKTAK